MMTAFEQRLLETLFPDVAFATNSLASYVMHRGAFEPLFFKELTDEVLEYALSHEKEYSIFAIHTDGSVDDVTIGWDRVFEKHKSTRGAVDAVLVEFAKKLPSNVATLEVKVDGVTLGYFPKPTRDMLRCVDRTRGGTSRMTVLCIQTDGVVKDITSDVIQYFKEYIKLRVKAA